MPGGDRVPVIRAVPGVVERSETGLRVVLPSGARPRVWWPAGYIPTAGDAVRVLMVDGEAQVLGPVITGQRPMTGTVSGTASSGRIPVDAGGVTYRARYFGTAPAIGQLVFFDWQATVPRIMPGAVQPEPEPTPDEGQAPPTRPAPVTTGSDTFAAIDAASWRPGYNRWDSGTVKQYRWRSESESRGAWFFGDAPTRLKGRTITRARLRLPARERVGLYNNTLTVHLYRHTARTRPGGDVNRVAGPHNVNIPGGWRGGLIDLPTSFGQDIANGGGGIGITGAPYMGFETNAQLILDWRR